MIKAKTFIQALHLVCFEVKKAKSFLKDKRLTQIEKTILQCHLHLRDNQNQDVIDQLTSLKASDSYVEAQRLLILGCAENNLCHYQLAQDFLNKSVELMKDHETPRFEYIAWNNLYIIALNQKNLSAMEEAINQIKKINLDSDSAKISLLRATFTFNMMKGNMQEATKIMPKLDFVKEKMSEHQRISFLIDKFVFFIKNDQFQACEETLVEMKKFRKFQLSANYNFMKQLLAHLMRNEALYVDNSDYEAFPVLFHQIKVIQCLEEGEITQADIHWKNLFKDAPQIYGHELFDYKGDKCLFSLCLAKHQKISNVNKIIKMDLPQNKEEALLKLLQESETPLHQGLIYELLWDDPLQKKSDLNKLAQLVVSLRNKTGLDIKFKKNCYFIAIQVQVQKKSS